MIPLKLEGRSARNLLKAVEKLYEMYDTLDEYDKGWLDGAYAILLILCNR